MKNQYQLFFSSSRTKTNKNVGPFIERQEQQQNHPYPLTSSAKQRCEKHGDSRTVISTSRMGNTSTNLCYSQYVAPSPSLRLNSVDLQEEIIEYMIEFALRSHFVARIVDNLNILSDYEGEESSSSSLISSRIFSARHGSSRPASAEALLDCITHASINRGDKIRYQHDETLCGICHTRLIDTMAISQMPCHHNHIYHTHCIMQWFKNHNTCPECRYELPTNDPWYEYYRRKRRRQQMDNMRYQSPMTNDSNHSSMLCLAKFPKYSIATKQRSDENRNHQLKQVVVTSFPKKAIETKDYKNANRARAA